MDDKLPEIHREISVLSLAMASLLSSDKCTEWGLRGWLPQKTCYMGGQIEYVKAFFIVFGKLNLKNYIF